MTELASELDQLLTSRPGPAVSILMPTHRTGPQRRQDAIRLKNLLRDAAHRLATLGVTDAAGSRMLEPAAALVADDGFWQHPEDGLAMFAAPEFFRQYRVPWGLPEMVCVGARFQMKPLLPVIGGYPRFYILALGETQVRLIESTRNAVHVLAIPGLPQGTANALRPEAERPELAQHAGPGHALSARAGRGEGEAAAIQLLRRIDALIQPVLSSRRGPLVLAGPEPILPVYSEVNTYPGLIDEGLPGPPDAVSAEALRQRAWEIARPAVEGHWREPAARHADLASSGRTAEDVTTVLPAAYQGRVDQLFVNVEAEEWGVFDPESSIVRLDGDPHPDSEELLNLAVIYALKRGATAHGLGRGQVPGGGVIAAILRY